MLDRFIPTLSAGVTGAVGIGLYGNVIPSSAPPVAWGSTIPSFPTAANDTIPFRGWYNKLYRKYAVLGVQWELQVQNVVAHRQMPIAIATYIDSYSATNNTYVHPTVGTMTDIAQWPDVRWYTVGSSADDTMDGCITNISGYYKPGQVKQSVENDEDIKTWTNTGSSPSLTEILNIRFMPGWNSAQVSPVHACNCRLKFRMTVQYRDVIPTARWPISGGTATTFTVPTDIVAS